MRAARRLARATAVLAALAGAGCEPVPFDDTEVLGDLDRLAPAPPSAEPSEAPSTAELHVGLEGALVAQSFDGVTGADVAASTRRAECAGWIARAPALVLMLDAPTDPVRFRVEPRGGAALGAALDTVLVIERGDGHLLCNDDADGLAPAIATALPAGAHRVWVGTWDREGAGARYTLHLDREVPEGTPRGEPTVDRLNAVCGENWCAGGTAYRFERVQCGGAEGCRVTVSVDGGEPGEVIVPGTRASWGEDGLDESFVEALGPALDASRAR